MTRVLTDEHLAALAEGRARRAEEDAKARAARQKAYSVWVREDARLYRAVLVAREAADVEGERVAHRAWREYAREMPELP